MLVCGLESSPWFSPRAIHLRYRHPPSLMDHSASVAAFRLRSVTDSGAVAKTCQLPGRRRRSFRLSFHPTPLGLSGAYWPDDPPDLTCKDNTRQYALDGPLLSCKQQVGGSSPPPAPISAGHNPAILALLDRMSFPAALFSTAIPTGHPLMAAQRFPGPLDTPDHPADETPTAP
jgi:hypothetical protein